MSMNMNDQPALVTERTEPTSIVEVAAQSSLIGPASESSRFSSEFSNNAPRSVELHIEELVLDGFELAHRYTIGEAVERELTRLFTEQGAPIAATQDVEIARLNSGAIEISAGSNAETIGMQLAKAIYEGFDQ